MEQQTSTHHEENGTGAAEVGSGSRDIAPETVLFRLREPRSNLIPEARNAVETSMRRAIRICLTGRMILQYAQRASGPRSKQD
jgi:hypothetical protein